MDPSNLRREGGNGCGHGHSHGALLNMDMDTSTALLNRDIDGNKSMSQLVKSDHGHLSQGNNYRSSNFIPHDSHWLNLNQYEIANRQIQQVISTYRPQEAHGFTMAGNRIQDPHNPSQKLESISKTANKVDRT